MPFAHTPVGLRRPEFTFEFFLIQLYLGVRFDTGREDALAWDPTEIDVGSMAQFINH